MRRGGTTMATDQIHVLEANLDKLPPHDRTFADSMLKQFGKKGQLSGKQWAYIEKLAKKAVGDPGAETLDQVEIPGFTAVFAMLQQAKKHLQHPRLTLHVPEVGHLQLYVATAASKYAGAMLLTDGKPFGQNIWYGRIDPAGLWTPPPALDQATSMAIYDLLVELAADPVGTTAANGKLGGRCVFCSLKLTDPKSIAAGYGPVCAQHWNLPWG